MKTTSIADGVTTNITNNNRNDGEGLFTMRS